MPPLKGLINSFLLISLLFSGGCWDVEEVEKKSFISIIGIDSTPDDRLLLTLQIPNCGALVPGGKETQQKLFRTIATTARTTLEACTDLEAKTSDTIDTGQTKVVIFGRNVVEKGIIPYLDCLGRFPKVNPQTYLVMADLEAGPLLKMEVSQAILPGLFLMDFFSKDSKKGLSIPIQLWQFLQRMDNPAIDPYLPVIYYEPDEQTFLITGIAAFHHDRLALTLTPDETKIFGLLSGCTENASFVFPWSENRKVGFNFLKTKVKYIWNESDTIQIRVKAEGYFLEDTGKTEPITDKKLDRYEKIITRNLERQANRLIQKLQQANTDILGLGRAVRAKKYGKWSDSWWRSKYPQLNIHVQVEFKLSRSGRIA